MKNLVVLAVLAAGCSGAAREDARVMKEAAGVHNAMMEDLEKLELRLELLRADSTVSKDSLIVWQSELEKWEDEIVEVPGNEEHEEHEEHAEGHHHHHDHKKLDVTAAQMLSVQQELSSRLATLSGRIQKG
ncbi:MAG TPA: hypothetical protein VG737_13230, partial [Cyclobacteriaceae bacterium]|nr:hypothetical protein [Cyclobacteriaceae bacterium]